MSQQQQKNINQTPQVQQQQQEVQEQMTKQLAEQLCQLWNDPKVQVKYSILNAILQYTVSDRAKQLFIKTNLFPNMVKQMKNPKLQKIILSTFIHFSSYQPTGQRLLEHLPIILGYLQGSHGMIQQMYFLFILNLSKLQSFTQKVIKKQENGLQPLIHALHQLIIIKPDRRWVVCNIFVNITSHQIGRQYAAKHKMYMSFLPYLNDPKQSMRLAILRILRNISFMWQKDQIVLQILEQGKHIIDLIGIHICISMIKCPSLSPHPNTQITNLVRIAPFVQVLKSEAYSKVIDYQLQIQEQLPTLKGSQAAWKTQVQFCVDIIIILSNCDFPTKKPVFAMPQLKRIVQLLSFSKISDQTKDKLEALQTFCFW